MNGKSRRDGLREAIAREEDALEKLKKEQQAVEKTLADLRLLLEWLEREPELGNAPAPPSMADGWLVAETPATEWAMKPTRVQAEPVQVEGWWMPAKAEASGDLRPPEWNSQGRLAPLPQLNSTAVTATWEGERAGASRSLACPIGRAGPEEKVRLFRELFRGREDVYPKLWVSDRTGKKGYAPVCANEWKPGVCEKPQVKCGKCKSRELMPVTDRVIEDHLRGKHVVGVYPLLADETCWFLAADFDKSSWREDVAAFREICREAGVPAEVERSRSGNGAHVWIFFTAAVAASSARRMGCHLLTRAMERRHQVGLDSYDRLFPNQDTMPKGGFGNLIALPLQHGPRQVGNTVFLDEQLEPYGDQWGALAAVRRMTPAEVEKIAEEAARRGQVIGVRLAVEEDSTPWERQPSRRPRAVSVQEPLPPRVRAVMCQRLFVEKARLPPAVLNQIKRLAAFQNPAFYEKQGMRLSTVGTPRVIQCAEEEAEHLALPRGCQEDLEGLLRAYGSELEMRDERQRGAATSFRFQGELTAVQREAVHALIEHEIGVFVAPPGTGKTVVGTYLVAERGCSTLVLVHRRPLMDQWVEQLGLFLGLEPDEIGKIGSGKSKPTGVIDVAMIQSLGRKGEVADLVGAYGQVIVDECHHVPAVSFERVMGEVKARFVTGLTATPVRRDGHQPISEMQLGPIRFVVDRNREGAARQFEHRLVVRETEFTAAGLGDEGSIQDLYSTLVRDEGRNRMILEDVKEAVREGRSPILLTERTEHLEYFEERLRAAVLHVIVLRGGMTDRERRSVMERLAAIPEGEERVLLATGRYIGEGFDDSRLDTLFLAMPVSWKGTLVQYAGRLHRLHPGKREVRIFDYVDGRVPMLTRMFEKRLRGYRAIGYAKEKAPSGLGASDGTEASAEDGE